MTHYSENTIKKIRFELLITELLIWGIYFVKGYLDAKIKAELELKKNKTFIKKKQLEIESEKVVSDKDLIREFPDLIEVPENVSKGFQSKWFLNLLNKLSKNAKNKIFNS